MLSGVEKKQCLNFFDSLKKIKMKNKKKGRRQCQRSGSSQESGNLLLQDVW